MLNLIWGLTAVYALMSLVTANPGPLIAGLIMSGIGMLVEMVP